MSTSTWEARRTPEPNGSLIAALIIDASARAAGAENSGQILLVVLPLVAVVLPLP